MLPNFISNWHYQVVCWVLKSSLMLKYCCIMSHPVKACAISMIFEEKDSQKWLLRALNLFRRHACFCLLLCKVLTHENLGRCGYIQCAILLCINGCHSGHRRDRLPLNNKLHLTLRRNNWIIKGLQTLKNKKCFLSVSYLFYAFKRQLCWCAQYNTYNITLMHIYQRPKESSWEVSYYFI